MNKKVIDFRLFVIVFVLGVALLIGGCSGSANNQKSDGKADKPDTEVVRDELQVNAEQREELNKKFKEADKVLQRYIIARFEGDVDTLESMYIPDGKEDMKTSRNPEKIKFHFTVRRTSRKISLSFLISVILRSMMRQASCIIGHMYLEKGVKTV
ncbi:hypothetical protein ACA29_02865 [Lederbergia galactosidilytica]|uniref:Uncharacterized protein n=1 Tax=Lederbergia galactosidilytica TaxID=217031 RepID=A0A0Q9YJB8_9BACI|nr:hypothetical protein ACA29_02865 [Lederbergia galactosidilytica]